MTLHFEKKGLDSRIARGLTNEALDSFITAFIGGVEFGYYFRVTAHRELWRWHINFPVGGNDMTGMGESENEVRDTINAFYNNMLEAAGLVERATNQQAQYA
jgi:hypothetical protein